MFEFCFLKSSHLENFLLLCADNQQKPTSLIFKLLTEPTFKSKHALNFNDIQIDIYHNSNSYFSSTSSSSNSFIVCTKHKQKSINTKESINLSYFYPLNNCYSRLKIVNLLFSVLLCE